VLVPAPHLFAVLASGSGTNFEALALADRRGELPGRIVALATDQPHCGAIERATRLGIEVLTPPVGRYRTRLEDGSAWVDALKSRGVDAVLLAGFMRRLHAPFLTAFPDAILNLHPSLLPSWPGRDAIRRALEHGDRLLGCTVHVVRDEVDAGPIVAQATVEVRDGDTLERLTERIHEAEHRLFPEAVRRYFGHGSGAGSGTMRAAAIRG